MVTKVFLDTNIVIDYLIEQRTYHHFAKTIIGLCYDRSIQGCISETVITNTAYVLRKTLDQSQLNFIFSGFSQFLQVLPASSNTILKACEVNIHDLEDAILYQLALENNCQYFITSNAKDFAGIEQQKLKVVSPEAFLEVYEQEY